ncbi:MAG: lycopene cyclase domain-containing protein [Nanoarchaeota archaeon]
MYEWLYGSLALLFVWLIFFIIKKDIRKEILQASLITMPLGLTEPLFVPEYWNPGTLFNLAQKTGFDIESLIFTFSVGGIAAVFYEIIFKTKHIKMSMKEHHSPRHRFHRLALLSPFIAFIILFPLANFNIIYTVLIAMAVGIIATILCRPDLIKKMLYTGFLFLILYFLLFFGLIEVLSPGYIESVWNLNAISGILILGIPLEELLFGFIFGALWASWYEHYKWYKIS